MLAWSPRQRQIGSARADVQCLGQLDEVLPVRVGSANKDRNLEMQAGGSPAIVRLNCEF